MKKILIVGANGFLGTNLLKFRNSTEIKNQNISLIAADLRNTNIPTKIPFYHIDITIRENTIRKLKNFSPDVIILTAAMTNVDQCETDKELATKINTEGPKNVLNACEKIGSKLVFLSTDYVFDGIKIEGDYYTEKDTPNPLSHYAKAKYYAELEIINSNIDYLICRTAVLYGWNKIRLNFITWILEKLKQNEKISVVTNQINSPTFVKNLAEIILKLIEKDAKGIYHTVGDGALSRFEIALRCAEIFEYDTSLVNPSDYIKQKAIRPKNAGLDIKKLKKQIGNELKIYNLVDGLNYMKYQSLI